METHLYYLKDKEKVLIAKFKSRTDAIQYIKVNTDPLIRSKLIIEQV